MIVCGVFYAHKDLNAQRPHQRRNILRPSGHRVTKSRSMNPCTALPYVVGVNGPVGKHQSKRAAVEASLAHLGILPPSVIQTPSVFDRAVYDDDGSAISGPLLLFRRPRFYSIHKIIGKRAYWLRYAGHNNYPMGFE